MNKDHSWLVYVPVIEVFPLKRFRTQFRECRHCHLIGTLIGYRPNYLSFISLVKAVLVKNEVLRASYNVILQ